jgi:hypothetical protein
MLLTQHGKEGVLGPIASRMLGATLEVVGGFDTDTLGSFTRDTPRVGTQLEAARTKARIAIERSGGRVGLGSEGSFGAGPFGFGGWNVEVVVLIDAGRGIEVVGTAHGPGIHVHGCVRSRDELRELAARAGFPEHGLVVRPGGTEDPRIVKGLRTVADLEAAFANAVHASADGTAFVESDLRAHQHPTRMDMIGRAGLDLAARLTSACPACGSPGFGLLRLRTGLPCAACGTPTGETAAEVHACVKCAFREDRPREGALRADPGSCPECNP